MTGARRSERASLWVARHAPVDAKGCCYSRADVAMMVTPEQAARLLVETFADGAPDVVWSSPSPRCLLVAERFAACLPSARVAIDEALHEIDFGLWDGQPWSTIETTQREAYDRWMQDWERVAPPRGESPGDLEARVRNWLARIGRVETEKLHVLIAHAGVVRALHVALDGISWPAAMALHVEHLAWTRFAVV